MVWLGLKTGREGAGQADGGVAVRADADLLGGVHQIQIAHQLAHAGDALGGQAPGGALDHLAGGLFAEQPLAELGHGHILKAVENGLVQVVLDNAGYLVLLIGNGGAVAQIIERQVGQNHLSSDPLLRGLGGDACQLVAGFFLVCLGHDLTDGFELVDMAEQPGFENHFFHPS